MQQKAKIEKVNSNGTALVSVKRKSACDGDCETCHGCIHPEETITVAAVNQACGSVGDTVTVESSSAQVIRLAILLYIMPIVLMIGAYFLPFASENAKIFASIAGLVIGLVICIVFSKGMKKRGKMSFCIVNIIKAAE